MDTAAALAAQHIAHAVFGHLTLLPHMCGWWCVMLGWLGCAGLLWCGWAGLVWVGYKNGKEGREGQVVVASHTFRSLLELESRPAACRCSAAAARGAEP